MPRYVLSLGSSFKQGPKWLDKAVKHLSASKNIRITAQSGVYKNLSVGMPTKRFCFNSCVMIETSLSPKSLLLAMRTIELSLGRIRTTKNGPRSLDIDIIFSDSVAYKDQILSIPHNALWSRDFYLIPLFETITKSHAPKSLTLSKHTYMIKGAHRLLSHATH